jgi:acyl-CoA oxidase
MLLLLREISHAESQYLLVSNFHLALSSQTNLSPILLPHLQTQFFLFAYHTLSLNPRSFSKSSAVSENDLDLLQPKILEIMERIRPHAVRLVDAWKIPDFLLDSALGRYDGKVYEDLFERAHRQNPLNKEIFETDYRKDDLVKGDGGEGVRRILAKL